MCIRLTALAVTNIEDIISQIGIFFNVMPHQEEGGGSIVLFQGVQDLAGGTVFIPGIEGQIDYLFSGGVYVGCVVFFKLRLADRSKGGSAFGSEGKSPGCGGQGSA